MTYFEQLYNKTVEAVESALPLPDNWLHSNTYEATIARVLLIRMLELQGLSRRFIEHYTGLSKSVIKKHINGYNDRLKSDRTMRIIAASVGAKLGLNN